MVLPSIALDMLLRETVDLLTTIGKRDPVAGRACGAPGGSHRVAILSQRSGVGDHGHEERTPMSGSAASGKIEAVEVYLRAEGFADVETDPPEIIPPAHFHIVRAVTAHGERRFPLAQQGVALLEADSRGGSSAA
jgi:hypothetical protein